MATSWALLIGLGLLGAGCTLLPKGLADFDIGMKERGIASWYGHDFHGWATANGEIYNMEALTGAHRTLPLGTVVRVTNIQNGEQVRVRINDRGPYVEGRILDLSLAAARKLLMVEQGIAAVQLEVVGHQEGELLLADDQTIVAPWSAAWLDQRASVLAPRDARHVRPRFAREEKATRLPPGDVLRERRARRVADILAAEQRVYAIASLQVP